MKSNIIKTFKNSKVKKFSTDDFDYEENDFLTESSSKPTNLFSKWYDEIKGSGDIESEMLSPADIQSLKKQASYVFNDAVVKNKSSKLFHNTGNICVKY